LKTHLLQDGVYRMLCHVFFRHSWHEPHRARRIGKQWTTRSCVRRGCSARRGESHSLIQDRRLGAFRSKRAPSGWEDWWS